MTDQKRWRGQLKRIKRSLTSFMKWAWQIRIHRPVKGDPDSCKGPVWIDTMRDLDGNPNINSDDTQIVSQMRSSRMGSSSYILILKNKIRAVMHWCGAYHRASDAKVRTTSAGRWEKCCLKEVRISVVLSLALPLGAHVYIYLCMCRRPFLSVGALMVIFILSL